MAYTITWADRGVITRWSGESSAQEIIRFLNELHRSPHFDDLRYSLHDYRQCEDILFDPDAMEEVAALDRAGAISNPRIRVAIVADTPKIVALMDAYLAAELSPYPLQLFANMHDARHWLDLSEPG